MAQKTDCIEYIRIDELYDQLNDPTKSLASRVLLDVRHADFEVIKCRQNIGTPPEALVAACAQMRQRAADIGGPVVEYYLPFIDGAFRKGI